mmetsp:Transcript_1781/g.3178  ORF Transcript_1781/g.3178 Transcript_1781/m.3178 type:complete len:526 (+) Transcript_1781:189-1766(+)|eukprot:CAMPEP_0182502766 /NCGR_PEP_ID=MMETSP1321-20130603/14049_1 /TAXON_ID=91990 /ORGANISM="Bolidomonas sp., Strain RCC1657" /LENGTH=525 /DNA_ID=CAMNT_0024707777 /DNA_START=140 /DNA_END=1717 /DNA_ORIENTATION=+
MPAGGGLRAKEIDTLMTPPVEVSFTELFFDLAIVSSTARLSEYAGSEGELSLDLRYVVFMFAFWYSWHQTNLLYNVTFETGKFRVTCICFKMIFLTFMASCITEHQTFDDDRRFGYYYIGTKLIDSALMVRVLYEASYNQSVNSASLKGVIGNVVSMIFHFLMWVAACAFSTEGSIISAYMACECIAFFLVRPLTQVLWLKFLKPEIDRAVEERKKEILRRAGGEGEEIGILEDEGGEQSNHTIKFDFKHFRERQALLVILVLGEAVAASTITESEEGSFSKTNLIAALCIAIAFLLKHINMDCPNAYEFKEAVEALGFKHNPDRDQKFLPFFGIFFLPLFYGVLLGCTTLVATGFRISLAAASSGEDHHLQNNQAATSYALALTVCVNAILKCVKFDQEWMQALVAEGFTDFRPVMELSVAGIMALLGAVFSNIEANDAADSYLYFFSIHALLLLILSALEQSYLNLMIKKLETGGGGVDVIVEEEEEDEEATMKVLGKPLIENNEDEFDISLKEAGGEDSNAI